MQVFIPISPRPLSSAPLERERHFAYHHDCPRPCLSHVVTSCMLRNVGWRNYPHTARSCPDRFSHVRRGLARPLPADVRRLQLRRRCSALATTEQSVSTLQQLVLWLIANGVLHNRTRPQCRICCIHGSPMNTRCSWHRLSCALTAQELRAYHRAARPPCMRQTTESEACSACRWAALPTVSTASCAQTQSSQGRQPTLRRAAGD